MPKNIMEVGRLEKELAKEREKTREAREACLELFEVAKDIARERDELRMKASIEIWKVHMRGYKERSYRRKIHSLENKPFKYGEKSNLYKACELME